MQNLLLAILITAGAVTAQSPPGQLEKSLADGRKYLAAHQSVEAAKAGLQAVQADPARWEGYLLIASAMADKKSYAEALPFYYEAWGRAPESKRRAIGDLIEEAVLAKATQQLPDLAGDWTGVLDVGAGKLHLVLHAAGNPASGFTSKLDSTDQAAMGITVQRTSLAANSVQLDIPAISAVFSGRISPDGKTISGTFQQRGLTLPLIWSRTTAK